MKGRLDQQQAASRRRTTADPRHSQSVDPTSRRRLGRRGVGLGHGVALAIGILALLVMVAAGVGFLLALALGIGVALSAGVIAALILAEREDGRIERMVEDPRADELP